MADEKAKENVTEKHILFKKADFEDLVKESLAEATADLKQAQKKFNLTPSAANEANLKAVTSRNVSAKFLYALKHNNTEVLNALAGTVASEDGSRFKYQAEGTDADGGYLVPDEFSTEVFKIVDDFSVLRSDAMKLRMNSNVMRLNTLLTNPTIREVGEAGVTTGTKMTFGEPVLTTTKYTAITGLTSEFEEDSEINNMALIQSKIGERLAQFEQNKLLNDATSGAEGLLVNTGVTLKLVNSGTTAANTTWDDLRDMITSLEGISIQQANNASFYMSPSVWNIVEQSKTTDSNYYSTDVRSTNQKTAWGKPVKVLNEMPASTAVTSGTKYGIYSNLADHLVIGDRRGMTAKLFDSGVITDSGGSSVNLITQDMVALRVTMRTAHTVVQPSQVIVLKSNT